MGSLTSRQTVTLRIDDLNAKLLAVGSGWVVRPFTHSGGDELYEVTFTVSKNAAAVGDPLSSCNINPPLTIELYHPGTVDTEEATLLSDKIMDYQFDDRIMLRRPSGTLGYMRPIYARIRIDLNSFSNCLGDMMLTAMLGRA